MGLRFEARDTAGSGMDIYQVLSEVGVTSNKNEASELVRTGRIQLNNQTIKDIQYKVMPGTYLVKKDGQTQVQITLL